MSARDDFGSNAGRPGGYGGGAGGLGNGGTGGGMGGGMRGGGAGINGGVGSRTGLTTGNVMKGIPGRDGLSFSGRPGSFAQQPGAFGMWGSPSIAQGPLLGVRRPGVATPVPTSIPGVNPIPESIPPQIPGGYPQFLSPNLGPFSPPNYTPPSNYPGSTYPQNNLGNPYGQYAPPGAFRGPDGFYSNSVAPGKGDYAGPSHQSAGGKGDYGGGNFGMAGRWR